MVYTLPPSLKLMESTNTKKLAPHVVADANIPFLEELLGETVRITRLPAPQITQGALSDADALITRTRTICNRELLQDTPVKFIGTATIGTDHIDFDYCCQNGINVVSAPGCNAPAVAQYVLSSILRLTDGTAPGNLTLGIVGVGHVGRIVESWARSLGFKVLLCDPPRAVAEGQEGFVDLVTIAAECDIITFHTPHTTAGKFATHHLANSSFFNSLKRRPIIINSARGPITDTDALLHAMGNKLTGPVIIDCWEGEPDINKRLLAETAYATPHIAGYSIEGKQRASLTVASALSEYFGLPFNPSIPMPGKATETMTSQAILESYDPAVDTLALRGNPENFEMLRNEYPLRHEPTL